MDYYLGLLFRVTIQGLPFRGTIQGFINLRCKFIKSLKVKNL